jgi:hypothetical protein
MENIWYGKLKGKANDDIGSLFYFLFFYGLNNRNWREKKLRKAFSFLARRKLKKKQLMTLAYCSTPSLFYGFNYRNWREKKF